MNLYEQLTEYTASDAYPFHMPGHKRRAKGMCDPVCIDITEIDGFDNLHHAEGILLEAEKRAARLYNSSETHFLVNGSTAGILAAIGACTRPGSVLLMARNSHRSAYNAAALNHVKTAYLYPSKYRDPAAPAGVDAELSNPAGPTWTDTELAGPIDPAGVDAELSNPAGPAWTDTELAGPIDPAGVEAELTGRSDVSAVFITSPTYDGVVSDIEQIARIVHRHNAVLIVDEAHGAHFGMHKIFPGSSVTSGADLVIHSLHKTLPALTQTALIHVNGPRVDRRRLRRLLGVYQTSSPSYVLMASIDRCVSLLLKQKGELFEAYARRLESFYTKTAPKHYQLIRTDDPSRILIRPLDPDMSAMQLYRTLIDQYHLQPEMVTPSYVLMLSSVCDDEEGFRRLTAALMELDRQAGSKQNPGRQDAALSAGSGRTQCRKPDGLCQGSPAFQAACFRPRVRCTIARAMDGMHEAVRFKESYGQISAEFLTLYPPGIPLLVPGEEISEELICGVLDLKSRGYAVQGPDDHDLNQILIVCPGRQHGDDQI